MPRMNVVPLSSTIDPDITAVANRAEKYIALSVDKAIANTIDPARFPIRRGSLEYLLAQRLKSAPPANPKRGEKAADIKAAKARRIAQAQRRWRERYTPSGRIQASNRKFASFLGPLAAEIRMDSRQAIADQLPSDFFFGRSPQLTEHMRHLAKAENASLPASAAAYRWYEGLVGITERIASAASAKTKLECLIREIKCIDETNGFCGTEAGSDEIRLGGMTVDPCAVVTRIAGSHVKDYAEDGDTKNYPAPDYRLFSEFSLQPPGYWPRTFFATFVLAESDMGGLGEFLSELVDLVKVRLAAELAATLGPEAAAALTAAGVAGAVAAAIAIALMVIVFIVVIAVFVAIKEAWEDDVFKPQTVMTTIESLGAADYIDWPAENLWGAVNFIGHGGHYQLFYSWRCR